MGIRWISYTSQNIPGNQSFELGFHTTLAEAKYVFWDFCNGVGSNDCSMSLYAVPQKRERSDLPSGEEMIATAKEFKDIGCPFDYPDRLLTRGPMGGIKIEGC